MDKKNPSTYINLQYTLKTSSICQYVTEVEAYSLDSLSSPALKPGTAQDISKQHSLMSETVKKHRNEETA